MPEEQQEQPITLEDFTKRALELKLAQDAGFDFTQEGINEQQALDFLNERKQATAARYLDGKRGGYVQVRTADGSNKSINLDSGGGLAKLQAILDQGGFVTNKLFANPDKENIGNAVVSPNDPLLPFLQSDLESLGLTADSLSDILAGTYSPREVEANRGEVTLEIREPDGAGGFVTGTATVNTNTESGQAKLQQLLAQGYTRTGGTVSDQTTQERFDAAQQRTADTRLQNANDPERQLELLQRRGTAFDANTGAPVGELSRFLQPEGIAVTPEQSIAQEIERIQQSINTIQRARDAGFQANSVEEAEQFLAQQGGGQQLTTGGGGGLGGGSQLPALPDYGQILESFGVSADVGGFATAPIQTFENTLQSLYDQFGLQEVRANMIFIGKEIEDLENRRDEELRAIDDDPWLTEGVRLKRRQKAAEKWDDQINNRVNRLTLQQSVYDTAREDARFIATNALNQYNTQVAQQQQALQFAYQRADAAFDAQMQIRAQQLAEQGLQREFEQQQFENELSLFEAQQSEYDFLNVGGVLYRTDSRTGQYEQIGGGVQSPALLPTYQSVPGYENASADTVLTYGTPEYIANRLASTAASKTKPVASEREQLGKFGNVIAQTSNLLTSLGETETGPVIGYLKSLNPYDFDARAVNAQVNALVPNVARGVYGEVGVLTDQDIARYLLTLPNINSTAEQNKFVATMTLSNAMRSYEQTLLNLANSNVNVSGFVDSYNSVANQVAGLERDLGVGSGASASTEEAIFDSVVGDEAESSSWIVNLWNKLF